MTDQKVNIQLEFTPNPNTLKFVLDAPLLDRGTANFTSLEAAAHSPLAQKILAIAGIHGVMIGTHFVTITKAPEGNWDIIAEEVPKTLESHLSQKLPLFDAAWFEARASSATTPEGDIERRICDVLDEEIRPAVAMDGGDITFDRYEAGVVYLHLQGSCSSCPSSVATLKMGVETRLREVIPEIQEVVAV